MLLPSPLLGPATWAPVAWELARRGWSAGTAAPVGPVRTPHDVLTGMLRAIPDGPEPVLVAHSNSGLYLAALADRLPVRALVFVDAGLPRAASPTPVAPEALVEHLAGLVGDDGLLPPWTEWWPEAEIRGLLPDDEARGAVQREQRRLPLAYFRDSVPSPPGWERLPAAYLAFGDTYAEERAEAERRGWPTETLPGGHLHQIVEPAAVAATLTRLVGLAEQPAEDGPSAIRDGGASPVD